MATAIERLRADIGATSASLPDDDAQSILDEAGETYSDTATASAYARVIAIRRIMGNAAKLVSYRQNASSENASDVFKHLQTLLAIWRDETAAAETAADRAVGSTLRAGRTVRKPARIREYP